MFICVWVYPRNFGFWVHGISEREVSTDDIWQAPWTGKQVWKRFLGSRILRFNYWQCRWEDNQKVYSRAGRGILQGSTYDEIASSWGCQYQAFDTRLLGGASNLPLIGAISNHHLKWWSWLDCITCIPKGILYIDVEYNTRGEANGINGSTVWGDRWWMGADKAVSPKNKRRIKRASSSRFPEDAKWNQLDSAKRSSLERSTRKVWSLADCI